MMIKIKKTVLLTLLAFSIAAFAGCGKKAPPRPPDMAAAAVILADGPYTI